MTAAPEPTRDQVFDALRTVYDPEIGLDIVTLGLVYDVVIDDGAVKVSFTLTTSRCPLGDIISDGVVRAVSALPGVRSVEPDLVWEPRWHPGLIAEGAL